MAEVKQGYSVEYSPRGGGTHCTLRMSLKYTFGTRRLCSFFEEKLIPL